MKTKQYLAYDFCLLRELLISPVFTQECIEGDLVARLRLISVPPTMRYGGAAQAQCGADVCLIRLPN